MRYFSKGDSPRNTSDRFEFGSRKPWPSILCDSPVGTVDRISCWGQIAISDRVAPAQSASLARTAARPDPTPRLMRGLVGPDPTVHLVEAYPTLQLSCALLWEDPLAGDPLRVEVTLSSAAYQQALRKAALTGTGIPPGLLHPTPATNWHEGVVLTLWRHGQGALKEVLAREAWKPHLRPQSVSALTFGKKPVAVSREWLASSTALNLEPGEYSLSVLWDGDDRVEDEALGGNGYLSTPTLQFTVKPVDTDVRRAVQGHRLALHAYSVGDTEKALQWAQSALALPGAREVLGSEGTPILAANAALKLGRYREAALLLQSAETWLHDEPAMIAQDFRQVLSPEIELSTAEVPGGPPRLTLTGLPDQTYEIESSADLVRWTSIDHRRTGTNRYEVTDFTAPTLGGARFYRAVWLP
jgi:hypothetical protein